MKALTAAKVGAFAIKVWMLHLMWFAIGAACGGFLGVTITQTAFIAMLKSRGLL